MTVRAQTVAVIGAVVVEVVLIRARAGHGQGRRSVVAPHAPGNAAGAALVGHELAVAEGALAGDRVGIARAALVWPVEIDVQHAAAGAVGYRRTAGDQRATVLDDDVAGPEADLRALALRLQEGQAAAGDDVHIGVVVGAGVAGRAGLADHEVGLLPCRFAAAPAQSLERER